MRRWRGKSASAQHDSTSRRRFGRLEQGRIAQVAGLHRAEVAGWSVAMTYCGIAPREVAAHARKAKNQDYLQIV